MSYDLWYWPTIQGRGEFVRLVLEGAGIAYRDRAREDGAEALLRDMAQREGFRPFAPPYLATGEFAIAQVAHILAWLTDRHELGSGELETDLSLIQLQLTVSDFVAEVHNTHHPVDPTRYYHEQKDAAMQAAASFRAVRMPKFLDHFEAALGVNEGPFVLGEQWSHVDTSLFQLVEGLAYAFPLRMAKLKPKYPRLHAVRDAVAALPGVAAYLASDRRLPFNEDGIFRHYPELEPA
ncbi:MAG TPA: glutathione S-transferase [Croceibacterium sp.]